MNCPPLGKTWLDLRRQGTCYACEVPLYGWSVIRRSMCGDCMAALYGEGHSLREVALRAGVSMQRVHQLLTGAGVKMRPKGRGMGLRPAERVRQRTMS